MSSNLSTPTNEIKKENYLPFTYQLPGLVKAIERLCVTNPRKKILRKTDMIVDFLLRDPLKTERKASLHLVKLYHIFIPQ